MLGEFDNAPPPMLMNTTVHHVNTTVHHVNTTVHQPPYSPGVKTSFHHINLITPRHLNPRPTYVSEGYILHPTTHKCSCEHPQLRRTTMEMEPELQTLIEEINNVKTTGQLSALQVRVNDAWTECDGNDKVHLVNAWSLAIHRSQGLDEMFCPLLALTPPGEQSCPQSSSSFTHEVNPHSSRP